MREICSIHTAAAAMTLANTYLNGKSIGVIGVREKRQASSAIPDQIDLNFFVKGRSMSISIDHFLKSEKLIVSTSRQYFLNIKAPRCTFPLGLF
jgi:hypothetical protein